MELIRFFLKIIIQLGNLLLHCLKIILSLLKKFNYSINQYLKMGGFVIYNCKDILIYLNSWLSFYVISSSNRSMLKFLVH